MLSVALCFAAVTASGALTAHEDTSAKRIAAIFRRMGLSHLAVADNTNKLVGIITRRHLIKPPSAATPALMARRMSLAVAPAESDLAVDEPDEMSLADLVQAEQAMDAPPLEQQAIASAAQNAQTRRAARRQGSILMASSYAPIVRFDDEEDDTGMSPPQDDVLDEDGDSMSHTGGVAGDEEDPELGNTGGSTRSVSSLYDAPAAGNRVSFQSPGMRAGNRSRTSSESNGSANKPSSLQRLNHYTKQI